MRSLYSRIQRSSIYHPATIGDIPQEVLRNAFIYLLPGESDLLAPSESCRAWRPVAQELMYYRQRFGKGRGIDRFLCGFHLKSLVFGLGIVSINRLELKIESIGKENILTIARLAAHSLSYLRLDCTLLDDDSFLSSLNCYATLEVVFLHCRGIRNLSLLRFDFGDDPDSISPSIKEGFSRLMKLELKYCEGDISMFINHTPIPNLLTITICSVADNDTDYDIVNAIASNYHSLVNFDLEDCYASSSNLFNIVEFCNRVERLAFISSRQPDLKRSDIEARARARAYLD
jgi:hypothetical protein